MAQSSIYRKQHQELERIAGEIADGLPSASPATLRQSLSKLAGVLKVHLAMEDKQMYPAMLAHKNAAVREMAADYQRSMGYLAPAFNAFYETWNSEEAIDYRRPEFTAEMQGIISALADRIKLENENLYALIDREEVSVN